MNNLTPITREEMLMNDEPMTPITREEKILAGEDLNPVTRREYFLKKYRHAGGDVMVEGLSVTENGTYTAPEGKAYSPVEVAVPLPDNAYLLKEASGSLVSFSDGADLPMPSFGCNIDAVQDLHGYNSPWVGGAGKNKLPMTVDGIKAANTSGTWSGNVYAERGVTFSIITDNGGNVTGIEANGTATNIIYFTISNNVPISAGAYRFTGCPNGGGWTSYVLYARGINNENYGDDLGNGVNHSFSEDTTIKSVIVFIASGYTVNNILFKPMYCLSSASNPNTFAPYSNICPISGHTGVDAWVRGKNLVNWKWNAFNNDKMEIFLKGGTYTLSAESTLSDGKGYIRGTKPSGEYVSREELGLISWSATTTSGLYYGGSARQQTYTFNVPNGGAKIEFGKINNNGTISAQLESGSTASTYTPYNPNSQTIQVSWQTEAGEVYGGYVDLVSGVLTVTHKEITYDGVTSGKMFSSRITGSNNAYYNSLPDGFDFNTTGRVSSTDMKKYGMINSHYDYTDDSSVGFYAGIGATTGYLQPRILFGADSDITTTELANQWLATQYANGTPWQVKYPLKTPITYQLTPTQIKSLLGNNNAWCSTGDVAIDYFAKEV